MVIRALVIDPLADGTIGVADRQHVTGIYGGIETTTPPLWTADSGTNTVTWTADSGTNTVTWAGVTENNTVTWSAVSGPYD